MTKPKIRYPENSNMMRRRGRESNPRIAVLQTATLPLGYPAGMREDAKYPGLQVQVSMRESESEGVLKSVE